MTRRSKVFLGMALMLAVSIGWPIAAHYRAKARVEAYQRELRARGEKLSTQELAPAYSSEGNAAASALVAAAGALRAGGVVLTDLPPAMHLIAPGRALVGWQQEPLPTPDSTNVWLGLRLAVERYQPNLDSMHQALRGPPLAFNLDYAQGFSLMLPHLADLKSASQWLSAETCLALHEGRTNDAWESLRALTALVEHFQQEPLLISGLVRMAMGAIAISATWEALQSTQIDEGQWAELQRAWTAVDVLRDAEAALAMERVLGEQTFSLGRQSYAVCAGMGAYGGGMGGSGLTELAQLGKDVLDNPSRGLGNLARRYPGYWRWKCWQSYDDELANNQTTQAALEALRKARQQRALGPALADFQHALIPIQQAHPNAGAWLGYSLAKDGGIGKFLQRVLRFETQRALVVGAIALKRYQLKHGSYPAQLSALMPEFVAELPRDPMDGQPLRCRLNPDGSFVLYSLGDNGVDDGGDPKPVEAKTSYRVWLQARDVVWPTPASATEVSAYLAALDAKRQRQANDVFQRRYGTRTAPPPATGAVAR